MSTQTPASAVQLVRCHNCGATNRISTDKAANGFSPVCGRCKTPLSLTATIDHPIPVTDADFIEKVERSSLPVLVDLWAPWCGPCRMIAPILDTLAKDFSGRAIVAKLNVDDNPHTAQRFRASSIPLLVILKDGKEVDRLVGVHPAPEIARRLRAAAG